MNAEFARTVEQHWFAGAPGALLARIDDGLTRLGKNTNSLIPDDLLAVDEFHIRGREATLELVGLAGFKEGDRIIDVGSGLGGPSRVLAERCGCVVEGVDLTAEYCDVANEIARRVGLAGKVRYRQGNALELPFRDDHFDGAWTQLTVAKMDELPVADSVDCSWGGEIPSLSTGAVGIDALACANPPR